MDNILKVKLTNGSEVEITVLDIVEIKDTNKKYIVYSLANSDNFDMYISILNETKDTYSLETIENEEELKLVEEYLININSEDGDY